MMTLHACADEAACVHDLAAAIVATLGRAIGAQGRAGLAVSGGRSPIPLFEELSNAALDWSCVDIALVDERFVAPSDPDSNEGLVRRYLLQGRAAQARFTGLVSDPANMDACLERANRPAGELTLAILGMGEDGHTASLFPRAPELPQALDPAQLLRYVRVTPVAAPHQRISMTLAALLRARYRILFIGGAAKRAVLERAAPASTTAMPVSFVLNRPDAPIDVYWHP
jgi:6-phosphogluconolactonase